MIYSQFYFNKGQRIKQMIAAIIILCLVAIFIKFFYKPSSAPRAYNNKVKRVIEANILYNQVTIYWQTENKESGCVFLYDQDKQLIRDGQSVFFDERDIENEKGLYINHYAIIKDLHKNTRYFYKLSGGSKKTCSYQYEDSRSFKTPDSNHLIYNFNPASGKVYTDNGKISEDTFVFLNIKKAYPLLTRTKSKGEWMIPLNNLYYQETLKPFFPSTEQPVEIGMINEESKQSRVTTSVSKLSPLPQIVIIGNNYDFLNNVLAAVDQNNNSTRNEIDIVFPQKGAMIPGRKPLIKGLALPKSEVVVTISQSNNTYSSKVVTDNDGIWKISLIDDLSVGEHILTVSTKDKNQQIVKLERKFYVAKSGEQVLGEATAEPTLTSSPSVTPLPTQTPVPFISPTKEPVSGSNFNFTIIGSISLIIMGVGMLLAFE